MRRLPNDRPPGSVRHSKIEDRGIDRENYAHAVIDPRNRARSTRTPLAALRANASMIAAVSSCEPSDTINASGRQRCDAVRSFARERLPVMDSRRDGYRHRKAVGRDAAVPRTGRFLTPPSCPTAPSLLAAVRPADDGVAARGVHG